MIVAPGAVVGRVPNVPLEVNKGSDLNFDVLWWADEERTEAVDVTEVTAQIRDPRDSTVVLDLAPSWEDNRVKIRIPAAVTSGIARRGPAVWSLEATAVVSGEHRTLAKGPVRFFEEVSL